MSLICIALPCYCQADDDNEPLKRYQMLQMNHFHQMDYLATPLCWDEYLRNKVLINRMEKLHELHEAKAILRGD